MAMAQILNSKVAAFSSSRTAAPRTRLSRSQPCLRRAVIVRADQKPVVDQDVDRSKTENIEAGNIRPQFAEQRADIGSSRPPTPTEAQSFDGPAPETINGRLAMLGVVAGLGSELGRGIGLKEQISAAPISILLTFVIISLASYIPIFRGYTRKEPFANAFWTPKAENWNGRVAMLGFTAMIVTEAIAGTSTTNFWASKFF